MCEFLNIRDVDSGNLSEYWDGGCGSTGIEDVVVLGWRMLEDSDVRVLG